MRKYALVVTVCALATGCATSQQQIDAHAPALNSWVGAPIEEFVGAQGNPTAVVENGNYQTYTFEASKTKDGTLTSKSCNRTNFNEPIDDYGRPAGCSSGERPWYTVTYSCEYGLDVLDDVITGWSMSGNNCKMMTIYGRPGQTETD